MKAFIRHIDRLSRLVGRAASWASLLLVLITVYDVLARYFFQRTAAWIMELEWHLFGLLFLLGGAYALQEDRHVRVDVFYQRMGERERAWVDLLGTLIFLLPWCAVLLYMSARYAAASWAVREGSPDPGGLPARYLIKWALVLGLGLLFLQGLARLLRCVQLLGKQ